MNVLVLPTVPCALPPPRDLVLMSPPRGSPPKIGDAAQPSPASAFFGPLDTPMAVSPKPLVTSARTSSNRSSGRSSSFVPTLSSELVQPPASDERDHERQRCDSTNNEARLSICSTSGVVYETVVVVGHFHGSDNVVYYLLEVRSWETPLDGYVIRRRYNDFKQFHRKLAECMPTSGAVRTGMTIVEAPFGRYTSLLCSALPSGARETSPLWSPPRERRGSLTGLRSHGVHEDASEAPTDSSESDTRQSAPAIVVPSSVRPSWNYSTSNVTLPFEGVEFDRTGRPVLPPLPPGGVSSFFTTREMLIKHRIQKFNKILAAVLSDTSTEVSALLGQFIQDNPSAQRTYVSLAQYAPMQMPINMERMARRRAMSNGKKAMREQLAPAAS
ncbi:hypothetical protein P43SY_002963 [Pythium insidiosum]|uniref:PX domain-containing protein n=1 Tax=Pythium insidiosum TaxID=114742 RepID=A0AAD5Q7F9_PYTIN|nr:hypothetical protein P43SY_002963 [Pythium insidiosum]